MAAIRGACCCLMSNAERQLNLAAASAAVGGGANTPLLHLGVTFVLADGEIRFEWKQDSKQTAAVGRLAPSELGFSRWTVEWFFEFDDRPRNDFCSAHASSVRALLARIQKQFPLADAPLRVFLMPDTDLGPAKGGQLFPLTLPVNEDPWKWLRGQVLQFARALESELAPQGDPRIRGRTALRRVACAFLGVRADFSDNKKKGTSIEPVSPLLDLRVTFDQVKGLAEMIWSHPRGQGVAAKGRVFVTAGDQLTWEIETEGRREPRVTSHQRNSIRAALKLWLKRFPTRLDSFAAFWISLDPNSNESVRVQEPPFGPRESPYPWIEDNIVAMAEALRFNFSPLGKMMQEIGPAARTEVERYERRQLRKEQKRAEEEARRHEAMARLAEERRRRELLQAETLKAGPARKNGPPLANPDSQQPSLKSASAERAPMPPVPGRIEFPELAFQEAAFPLTDLGDYFLRERAALWWISNQSDDLLCLPHCRIERLDYQLRTALRVLGPMRGRALLSDEVGLGKTIEAGLVLKELLTRGLAKNFLILTVPSLVDQWEEELLEKFGLTTVTTNQAGVRADPQKFWSGDSGVVASLHTLKQPAHLEIARQTRWDLVIVDEAHYLRNRESQAWQAVNSLPRRFLLLLTATPVQNSLEELYNLVTLLQPGQLLSPKEFRARFIDPGRPRHPREPEELRRLLGQVMIRNTRANAGLKLPPRRAETVMFEPDEDERAFWKRWETDFRSQLGRLTASQSQLWGRLLLQAAGSSPAAWRGALEKFPDRAAAKSWREQSPLEASWKRKCELLVPLTRAEGGAVIFTQFLETQAAVEAYLRQAGVEAFVINGTTPPPERQPISEQFQKRGGALLLTHSGTEGRNLQFCHRLANFDLPWNPMEIEQRIGRLHRLGQQHAVRIYNFVQAGTLQEHLLEILQEKLNLFELVVGETGLVLGDRFSSDEFADEIFRRWRESEGRVAEAVACFGDELVAARERYNEVKQLDETLFAKDYESL
jgi:superfamily II DNA or RNA helicase